MSKNGFGVGFALGAMAATIVASVAYQKRGAIRRKVWQLKAKAEVHRRLRDLRDVSADAYDSLVDDVLAGYRTTKDIAGYEVDALAEDLKRRWSDVKRQFETRRTPEAGDNQ